MNKTYTLKQLALRNGQDKEEIWCSFNGDIYTDFESIEQKPMLLARNDKHKVKGTSFKVEAKSVISFGGGGPQLDFETFNGDVFIRKK